MGDGSTDKWTGLPDSRARPLSLKYEGDGSMAKYRKKSVVVVVEAYQLTADRYQMDHGWPAWLEEAWRKPRGSVGSIDMPGHPLSGSLTICTLEGEMYIDIDDWIIKGIAGELCLCKPDIFEQTYDPESPR